jgi:hypothetical protein
MVHATPRVWLGLHYGKRLACWLAILSCASADALKGLHYKGGNGPQTFFERRVLPGYRDDYSGFYHWLINSRAIDMGGRLPTVRAEGDRAVYCDIKSGTISTDRATPEGWQNV